MTVKIGINGFGRIGRLVFRGTLNDPRVEVVAVNDLTDAATLAHLLKYDTNHGTLDADVKVDGGDEIIVNGKRIKVMAERDPKNLPWGGELGVEYVVEATGIFRSREQAQWHIDAGAKKSTHYRTGEKRRYHNCDGRQRARLQSGRAPCYFQRFLHHQLLSTGSQGY